MASRNVRSSQGSPDMPDFDSGSFALQTPIANDNKSAGYTSANMADRAKPPLPTKKSHLTDLSRLKKELDDLREQKEQAEEMTDMMAQDLCLAQDEVQEKNDELKKNETELRKCVDDMANWREQAQILSKEIQEQKAIASESRKSNRMRELTVTSEEELFRLRGQVADLTASLTRKEAEIEDGLQNQKDLVQTREEVRQLKASLVAQEDEKKPVAELANLRRQISQLKSTINEKDNEITTKVSLAAGVSYDKWQVKLREAEESFNAQLAQEQELRRVTETTLHEMTARLGTDSDEEKKLRLASEASLQNAKNQFEIKLRETEERMGAQLSQEQELRRGAETKLHDLTTKLTITSNQEQESRRLTEESFQSSKRKLETDLQETTERTALQIAEWQKRALGAEASLQEYNSRMETQVDHEPLLERIRSQEWDIQNERQRCEWFKKNSEKLSRKIKDTQTAYKMLEQSEYVLKRQLDDLKSHVGPFEQGRRAGQMPGAY